jgi:hypothetical protein
LDKISDQWIQWNKREIGSIYKFCSKENTSCSLIYGKVKNNIFKFFQKALQDTQQKTIDFSLILKDLQIVLSKADVLALNKKFYSVLEDKTLQEILSSIGNISVEENTITDEIHLEGFQSHVKSTKTYLRKEKVEIFF